MTNHNADEFSIKRALHLKRALRLVWQVAPGWTMVNAAIMTAQGLVPLIALYLIKLMVDALAAGLRTPGNSRAFGHVAWLIALACAVSLLSALLRSIGALASEALAQEVTDHAQQMVHAKSIAVDLEYYENPQYQDTLHRAQQDAPARPTRIVNALVQVFQSGLSLVGIAGLLLFSLHWAYAAILTVAALPGLLLRLRFADQMYRWQRQRTSTERLLQYFHWLLTLHYFAKEI